MGISLYGLTPATTYDALIKTGDNAPIDATLKPLSDGVGTNLPMEVSTAGVNFTNQLQQGGVAVPTAAQVAAKQDTLVSGTNIKTINGTSVLGSGNIVTPTTNPSGVSGAIQFSNGSAFASDAANLFWDDANNRLGVGTNAPTNVVDIKTATGGAVGNYALVWRENTQNRRLGYLGADNVGFYSGALYLYQNDIDNTKISANGSSYFMGGSVGIGTSSPSARTHIIGSGSTSATTSLLVQNSAGTAAVTVTDDLNTNFGGNLNLKNANTYINNTSNTIWIAAVQSVTSDVQLIPGRQVNINNIGTYTAQGSALLQLDSTSKGFLPPRMTTTQKNAIATPATGLVLYDSTTNKLCCYNGSTWNDLF